MMQRERGVALGVCLIAIALILGGVVNVDLSPRTTVQAQTIATPALQPIIPAATPPAPVMIVQTAEPQPTPEPQIIIQQVPAVVEVQPAIEAPPVQDEPAPIEALPAPTPAPNEGSKPAAHSLPPKDDHMRPANPPKE